MPVDREHRDAVAEVLASFLRGEIDRKALLTRCDPIRVVVEAEVDRDAYLDELLGLLHYGGRRPISEAEWNEQCRALAFLRSDLQEVKISYSSEADANRPRQILLARWHTVGLAIAVGFSLLLGWWIYAIACVVSFLQYMISMQRHDAIQDEARRATMSRVLEFYPFASEGEWLAHQGFLEEYRIPEYDPNVHGKSLSPTSSSEILVKFVGRVSIVIVFLMFLSMYLFTLFMWPLWLVMMSLCPRGVIPPDPDRP